MTDWFREKRFGLFVHWGLYAVPGVHEQYWQRWNVPADKYVKLAEEFNPVDFNPATWLDLAQDAGMEYVCFTTKHHDGFCMWDTAQTDFNITNTPYGRDTLAMLADECQRRDVPLVLYYSVVDWHHRAYPNIGRHHEITTDPAAHDWETYMAFVKAQIEELCRNYGTIHGVWWDMNVPEHRDPSVNQRIRELQPQAVVNNRGFDAGDFATPERDYDPEGANVHGGSGYQMAEACQSVGTNSWGYRREEDYFSTAYFTANVDSWLAKGCNYLLNVGPDARGLIPDQAADILRGIGDWLIPVRESFNGRPERVLANDALLTVRAGNALYVHCPRGLTSSSLDLAPLAFTPRSVVLMNDGRALPWTHEPMVYERGTGKRTLRIREIPVDELKGPAVLRVEG